mgnify:CR=1 FL=1
MNDLKQMTAHEVMICLRCAGHRRSEMNDIRPMDIKGVNFGAFAISNAIYKGPLIKDVLLSVGITIESLRGKHLYTKGKDEDFKNDPVETSILMDYALDPMNEVILAY